jgi:hypothetical protein
MAAARSLDPVLAKIRLMWVLIVWLLRNKCQPERDVERDPDQEAMARKWAAKRR